MRNADKHELYLKTTSFNLFCSSPEPFNSRLISTTSSVWSLELWVVLWWNLVVLWLGYDSIRLVCVVCLCLHPAAKSGPSSDWQLFMWRTINKKTTHFISGCPQTKRRALQNGLQWNSLTWWYYCSVTDDSRGPNCLKFVIFLKFQNCPEIVLKF